MTEWDNLKILSDKPSLARYTAERIVRMANATLEHNDTFSIALSGGSTPQPVYEILATTFASVIDWSRVHLWWGDERAVSPDDEQSNYRIVKEVLLDKIDIPEKNVHQIRGEDEPQQTAKYYEDELKNFFKDDEMLFDLNLLGMGDDGHTASLFPNTAVIHEEEKWVLAHHVEAKGNLWRITLTPPTILKSANIMFLVSGAAKAEMLKTVLEGAFQPYTYPAQLIVHSKHQNVVWAVDEAAASRLG